MPKKNKVIGSIYANNAKEALKKAKASKFLGSTYNIKAVKHVKRRTGTSYDRHEYHIIGSEKR
jgi:hypothetical protein